MCGGIGFLALHKIQRPASCHELIDPPCFLGLVFLDLKAGIGVAIQFDGAFKIEPRIFRILVNSLPSASRIMTMAKSIRSRS